MKLPQIRRDLLIQDLDGEVLIYDTATNKSYCLNETARIVFNQCNGKTTLAELKLQTGFTDDVIYLSLDELKRHNLILTDYVSPFIGMSRREVVRKVGLASMIALPVISSLIAPHSTQAASSGCPPGNCIGPNVAYCIGRDGQTITRQYYSSTNGTCSGPESQPAGMITCPNPTTQSNSPVSGSDRCIT